VLDIDLTNAIFIRLSINLKVKVLTGASIRIFLQLGISIHLRSAQRFFRLEQGLSFLTVTRHGAYRIKTLSAH
jgi:hypothetical protein